MVLLKLHVWIPPLEHRTEFLIDGLHPRLVHCICCFLQKRLLITCFTVDSTKPVLMRSPAR